MRKDEKEKILNAIDSLSRSIEFGGFDEYIKEEFRKPYFMGQLDALLMIKETIQYEDYK